MFSVLLIKINSYLLQMTNQSLWCSYCRSSMNIFNIISQKNIIFQLIYEKKYFEENRKKLTVVVNKIKHSWVGKTKIVVPIDQVATLQWLNAYTYKESYSKKLVMYSLLQLDHWKGLVFLVSWAAIIFAGSWPLVPHGLPAPSCCIPKLE